MRLPFAVALLTNLITSICVGQIHQSLGSDLHELIEKERKKKKVTGLSISLAIDGALVLSEGYGFSNKEKMTPVTQKTQFAVGSISKLITSTAVLKLYNDEIINIDKPYSNYVPEFSMKSHFENTEPFTVRHLLSHFAGLPRVNAKGYSLKTERPLNRILDISKQNYLISPPGIVNQYSDWGVDLLAVLVEKVSGLKFEEFVAKEIFTPLGMSESNYGQLRNTNSYNNDVRNPTYEYSYVGSDGLNSTSEDLMKLGLMYLNNGEVKSNTFFRKEIAVDAQSSQFVDAPLRFSKEQGLMWDIRSFGSYTRISKGGIHEPFYSMLYIVPEYNMTVAICSNSNSSSSIHRSIFAEIISYLAQLRDSDSSGTPPPELQPVRLSNEQMNKVEGLYSTDQGIVNITKHKAKFKVEFLSIGKTFLGYPHSNNTIKVRAKLLGLIPISVIDVFWEEVNSEVVVGEQYSSGYRSVGGVKVDKKPIPDRWRDAVGIYRISNQQKDEYTHLKQLELKINKYGILELSGEVQYPKVFEMQLALSPVSPSLAIVPGYSFDFFAGETIRLSKKDDTETLIISGYELSKVVE